MEETLSIRRTVVVAAAAAATTATPTRLIGGGHCKTLNDYHQASNESRQSGGKRQSSRFNSTLKQKQEQHQQQQRRGQQQRQSQHLAGTRISLFVGLVLLACLLANCNQWALVAAAAATTPLDQQAAAAEQLQLQQANQPSRAALEAELNSILQQHEAQESNRKLLSEAIISRLMLGNLTTGEQSAAAGGAADADGQTAAAGAAADSGAQSSDQVDSNELEDGQQQQQQAAVIYSEPEASRLRRILGLMQAGELSQLLAAGQVGGASPAAFSQFPVLPASQAATIKRASAKMSSLLRQQQHHQQQLLHHHHQARASGYGRNSFDFGLGKRPDASISSSILRLGDGSLGGHVQPISGQLGKRPAHRYDFGLGKRVASPAYPRYDFGLGKRAPNKIRYDFGLGK